ncbi:MAG: hypothetical protein H6828_01455 [Planctomycetes bacterium]|nr:hypothetical protein [Planctomycetota bacterium]
MPKLIQTRDADPWAGVTTLALGEIPTLKKSHLSLVLAAAALSSGLVLALLGTRSPQTGQPPVAAAPSNGTLAARQEEPVAPSQTDLRLQAVSPPEARADSAPSEATPREAQGEVQRDWREPYRERYAAMGPGELLDRRSELLEAWDEVIQGRAQGLLDAGAYIEVEGQREPELELHERMGKSLVAFSGTRADGTDCTRWVLVDLESIPETERQIDRELNYACEVIKQLGMGPRAGKDYTTRFSKSDGEQ